ncbi:MAG: gliding motility-associated C-terminal domain-containing protein [Saprospiraceae bacterium]
MPSPELFLGNDTSFCDGNTLALESNFSETIWQGNEESSFFEVLESGIYTAEISDENCTTYDSIKVDFLDCEQCFDVPNAFTPNGDRINDTFFPQMKCFDFLIDYQLQIFNRWGELVFKTENINESWNGKKNGKAQSTDVFVWKLIYSFEKNGKIITKIEHGDVSLIR